MGRACECKISVFSLIHITFFNLVQQVPSRTREVTTPDTATIPDTATTPSQAKEARVRDGLMRDGIMHNTPIFAYIQLILFFDMHRKRQRKRTLNWRYHKVLRVIGTSFGIMEGRAAESVAVFLESSERYLFERNNARNDF